MTCKICGKPVDADHFVDDWASQMKKHQMCHTCNFWRGHLEDDAKREPHTWCMIDGTHYIIEPDAPKSHFQGFGGAEFTIVFDDGVKVVTHNLWCQGEPEGYWKEKFPDNAHFKRDLKWKKIGDCNYLTDL